MVKISRRLLYTYRVIFSYRDSPRPPPLLYTAFLPCHLHRHLPCFYSGSYFSSFVSSFSSFSELLIFSLLLLILPPSLPCPMLSERYIYSALCFPFILPFLIRFVSTRCHVDFSFPMVPSIKHHSFVPFFLNYGYSFSIPLLIQAPFVILSSSWYDVNTLKTGGKPELS